MAASHQGGAGTAPGAGPAYGGADDAPGGAPTPSPARPLTSQADFPDSSQSDLSASVGKDHLLDCFANPSSSLEAVTLSAFPFTSGSALPIAMLSPESANINVSLGMSPMVAICSTEIPKIAPRYSAYPALVGVGMGDVQVVGLGGGGRHMVAELIVCGFRGSPDGLVIVTHSNDLRDVVGDVLQCFP